VLDQLKADFPEFVFKLSSSDDATPKRILPGVPLPESYKRFLRIMRGFWLFGGAVRFWLHPFFYTWLSDMVDTP